MKRLSKDLANVQYAFQDWVWSAAQGWQCLTEVLI